MWVLDLKATIEGLGGCGYTVIGTIFRDFLFNLFDCLLFISLFFTPTPCYLTVILTYLCCINCTYFFSHIRIIHIISLPPMHTMHTLNQIVSCWKTPIRPSGAKIEGSTTRWLWPIQNLLMYK